MEKHYVIGLKAERVQQLIAAYSINEADAKDLTNKLVSFLFGDSELVALHVVRPVRTESMMRLGGVMLPEYWKTFAYFIIESTPHKKTESFKLHKMREDLPAATMDTLYDLFNHEPYRGQIGIKVDGSKTVVP